jgi:hypothetical protein
MGESHTFAEVINEINSSSSELHLGHSGNEGVLGIN